MRLLMVTHILTSIVQVAALFVLEIRLIFLGKMPAILFIVEQI
jgi:hypothetical protein